MISEKELSGLLYERGVDGQGFARIRRKNEITNHNVKQDRALHGEASISHEHVKNNENMREMLAKSADILKIEYVQKMHIAIVRNQSRFLKKNLPVIAWCVMTDRKVVGRFHSVAIPDLIS